MRVLAGIISFIVGVFLIGFFCAICESIETGQDLFIGSLILIAGIIVTITGLKVIVR